MARGSPPSTPPPLHLHQHTLKLVDLTQSPELGADGEPLDVHHSRPPVGEGVDGPGVLGRKVVQAAVPRRPSDARLGIHHEGQPGA